MCEVGKNVIILPFGTNMFSLKFLLRPPKLSWDIIAPLLRPVVPDVYTKTQQVPGLMACVLDIYSIYME